MNILLSLPVALLTKSETFIIGPISTVLGYILDFIFNIMYGITQNSSLAISIIFFTIIVKVILLPLMINQQKSMRRMQLVQPKLQKIQNKYKGKKDPESQQKMQQELSAFYKKNKVNPFGGCLPLLIQMPIFFALFTVLRNTPAYINSIGADYTGIAEQIQLLPNYADMLQTTLKDAVGQLRGSFNPENVTSIVDVLAKASQSEWTELLKQVPTDVASIMQPIHQKYVVVNNFLGFNLTDSPGWMFPGIIFPIISGGTTYLQSKLMTALNNKKKTNKKTDAPDTAMQTQKTMNAIFPFMTAMFTATMPLGLGIYWITSNLFQIVQQLVINTIMTKEEEKRRAERRAAKKAKLAGGTKPAIKNKEKSQKDNSKKGVK